MVGFQEIREGLSKAHAALPKIETVALGLGLVALVAGIVMTVVSVEVLKQIGADCPAQGMCTVIEKTGVGMSFGGLFVGALGYKLHCAESKAAKEQPIPPLAANPAAANPTASDKPVVSTAETEEEN